MLTCAPSSPRSPGVVCYSLALDTPVAFAAEPATVFLDTPVAGSKARRPRAPRQVQPPSRHSARLALSRSGQEGPEPSIPEKAERRAASHDALPGTSRSVPPTSNPTPTPPPGPSGSRFSVLASVALEHLEVVAADCGIVFRGERGPRLEQIEAIKAKEIFEGSLAAARAQEELERVRDPQPAGPVPSAPGSGRAPSPEPNGREDSHTTPPRGGVPVGELPRCRPGPRPLVGPDPFPVRGPTPLVFSNECP